MSSILSPDGSKQIVISKELFAEARQVLSGLYQETKCSAVVLSDESGLVICESGPMGREQKALLSSVVAGNYSAGRELAKLLGEQSKFGRQFLEGEKLSLYVSEVNPQTLIFIIFDEQTSLGKLRLILHRAAARLALAMEEESTKNISVQNAAKREEEAGFRTELFNRLDSVLTKKTEA